MIQTISTLRFGLLCGALVLAGCASRPADTSKDGHGTGDKAVAAGTDTTIVKSRDGSYTGEVKGQAVAGSKLAKLQIGMTFDEVQAVFGRTPDRMHTYESGKRWIPFYFGNDARRMQVLYKGEGCLMFTAGNVWGSTGGDLIGIHHDASGDCYQP